MVTEFYNLHHDNFDDTTMKNIGRVWIVAANFWIFALFVVCVVSECWPADAVFLCEFMSWLFAGVPLSCVAKLEVVLAYILLWSVAEM